MPTARELKLMTSCPDAATKFVILCASDLGIRSGTAFKLMPEEVAGGRVRTLTKGQRPLDLPLSPALLQCLMPLSVWPCPEGWTICEVLSRKRMEDVKSTVTARFQKWRRKSGMTRVVTFHDLRRGLAQRLFRVTGDMRQVQALLCHATLNSTFWYLHAQTKLNPLALEKAREMESA